MGGVGRSQEFRGGVRSLGEESGVQWEESGVQREESVVRRRREESGVQGRSQ